MDDMFCEQLGKRYKTFLPRATTLKRIIKNGDPDDRLTYADELKRIRDTQYTFEWYYWQYEHNPNFAVNSGDWKWLREVSETI